MSTELAETAATVPRSSALPLRRDQPRYAHGDRVWWKSKVYVVDSLEFQGERWCAVLVRLEDWGADETRAWFAPCAELSAS